ncbi:MAG TPA: sigma-70 family RNA polymerase sigma factor [Jiangellaceae bacterium]
MDDTTDLVEAARRGDSRAFERLVAAHRRELHAHCYRMLGSVQDAEDAVQEALLAAWRGLPGFEGRSSLRSWLHRIATNACLRLIDRRPRRVLSPDYGPARTDTADLGEPVTEPIWLEPIVTDLPADAHDPEARYVQRESIELAFVAALQYLPGTQRAVLILRDVLKFSAAEVAELLGTTPASVNSALQRARKAVGERIPPRTQQAELDALGAEGRHELVEAFVTAWERSDVAALLQLLTEDARFTMPPMPAWFLGRDDVARFFTDRVFATPWRLAPITVNAQLGFACYAREADADTFRLGAVNALTLRHGKIAAINGFIDPDLYRHLGLPGELS